MFNPLAPICLIRLMASMSLLEKAYLMVGSKNADLERIDMDLESRVTW